MKTKTISRALLATILLTVSVFMIPSSVAATSSVGSIKIPYPVQLIQLPSGKFQILYMGDLLEKNTRPAGFRFYRIHTSFNQGNVIRTTKTLVSQVQIPTNCQRQNISAYFLCPAIDVQSLRLKNSLPTDPQTFLKVVGFNSAGEGVTPPMNANRAGFPDTIDALAVVCPDFLFIGARGSGEKLPLEAFPQAEYVPSQMQDEATIWLGPTVGGAYNSLISTGKFRNITTDSSANSQAKTIAWDATGITNIGNFYSAAPVPSFTDYPGWGAYVSTLALEKGWTADYTMSTYERYCQNSRFILVGYSQGAAFIRHTISNGLNKHDQRIAAVVLVADPLLQRNDTRLAISSDSRWGQSMDTCGVLRIAATIQRIKDDGSCLSFASNLLAKRYLTPFLKALEIFGGNVGVSLIVTDWEVNPDKSTLQITQQTGIPITSVCFAGDIVCSPFSTNIKGYPIPVNPVSLYNGTNIHSHNYKTVGVSKAISDWLLQAIKVQ